MSKCKWCDRKGFFLSVNKIGLCKSCQTHIESKIYKNKRAIRNSMRLFDNSEKKAIKIKSSKNIIETAQELLKLEKKGIPTTDPSPSKLIKEYSTIHDKLTMNSMPEKIDEALSSAESALLPFAEIYIVNQTLINIKDAKAFIATQLHPQIIALINQKGGVGKTTSTINLGAGLAKLNKKVLLIDFDPQANLTDGMGTNEEELKFTVYNLLKGDVHYEDTIIKSKELSIIPSNIFLSKAEKDFSNKTNNIFLLRNAIKEIKGFDYVLIDCPPSLGILTLNALTAAEQVIIPLLPEYYALKGIRKLLGAIEFVRKKRSDTLTIMGIIGTRYDNRKILHREVLDKIRESLGNNIFYTIIRENIALAEASSHGNTIFEYEPKSHGAEDYMKLSIEVIERTKIYKQMQQ